MAWFFSTEYKDRDIGTDWTPEVERIASEHERFRAIGAQLAQDIEARYLAGPRDRNSPGYPWFGSSDVPRMLDGWPWQIPDRPFVDQFKEQQGDLVDIVSTSFITYAISQRVIDMIEAIEPNVHQYLPYQMLQPDSSVHPDKRWLLNVCTRAEVVDIERSNVQWAKPPSDRWFIDAPGERRLLVKAKEARSRAIWSEWRYNGAQTTLISDALWNALQASGVRGWQPHFAYSRHIEEV